MSAPETEELMLSGISLFFGIAQKAFSPHKLRVPCGACGADRHEGDSKFCRVCGTALPLSSPPRARRKE
jgi:voltage-gated potassium channel